MARKPRIHYPGAAYHGILGESAGDVIQLVKLLGLSGSIFDGRPLGVPCPPFVAIIRKRPLPSNREGPLRIGG